MTEDGRELMTDIYQAEDFLGVNVLLSNPPISILQRRLKVASCFFLKKQMEKLLQLHPDEAGKFINILLSEVRDRDAYLH